jgi:Na+/H+ antiporter NhaC
MLMDGLARNRTLRLVLALIVIVTGIAIAATTGDSWAVRWVTLLLSADVAARLAMMPRA